jgi:hypothetical protein
VFGMSMSLSVPAAEQFRYCVFPLAAAMLLLSTCPRYPLSLDALLARRRPASLPRSSDKLVAQDAG